MPRADAVARVLATMNDTHLNVGGQPRRSLSAGEYRDIRLGQNESYAFIADVSNDTVPPTTNLHLLT